MASKRTITACPTTLTKQLLQAAGIGPGARVLDVGCGPGNTSLLIAELVGPSGSVLGIDRNEAFLQKARDAMESNGVSETTSFTALDLDDVEALSSLRADSQGTPFTAVVIRRVLMYLPDPGATLKAVADTLGPGGVCCVQEHSYTPPMSSAPMPLHTAIYESVWATVGHENADTSIGPKLWGLLTDSAGLSVEHLSISSRTLVPDEPGEYAFLAKVMMPRMLDAGTAPELDINLDTIDADLAAERTSARTAFVGEHIFCTWALKPLYT